jgi:hypothetical protein
MGAQKSSQVKSGHSKLGLSQDLDLELASIGKPHILWRFNVGFLHISTIWDDFPHFLHILWRWVASITNMFLSHPFLRFA